MEAWSDGGTDWSESRVTGTLKGGLGNDLTLLRFSGCFDRNIIKGQHGGKSSFM